MPIKNCTSFSQIVSSEQSVRTTFSTHGPTRFWWTLILMLHGKPVDPALSAAETIIRVAEGFKFYAALYRSLAVVFLVLAPTLLAINMVEADAVSSYWAGASLLAGVYLWSVSGLGYAGVKCYATDQEKGTGALVAFMVMIVAFLSLFVAVISVTAHYSGWLPSAANLAMVGAMFVFGVGSYMIEILYLATQRASRSRS